MAKFGQIDERLRPVKRWTPSRKDELLLAVQRGELTASQVTRAHSISWEEWDAWRALADQHGRGGLKVTANRRSRH